MYRLKIPLKIFHFEINSFSEAISIGNFRENKKPKTSKNKLTRV